MDNNISYMYVNIYAQVEALENSLNLSLLSAVWLGGFQNFLGVLKSHE